MGRARSKNGGGNVCRILVGNPEGKRPLGSPRRRWLIILKKYILERIGWYGLDWSRSG
jgi:hypothetical protein